MPTASVHRRKRVLGILAFLAWLSVGWTFWRAQSVRPRQTLPLDLSNYSLPTVTAGSPIAIINPSRNELAFLDAATGKKGTVLKGDMKRVGAVIAAGNYKTLATFNIDSTWSVWLTAEEGEPATFQLPGRLAQVACSPDGQKVAGTRGDKVRVWDVASQKEVAILDGHLPGAGNGFFPDSRTLATVTAEGIKLWDIATQRPRLTLAHPNSVRFGLVAIAPDGRWLATCDNNSLVTVWDCNTGKELASYCSPEPVNEMFLSPDGSRVGLRLMSHETWLDKLTQLAGDIHIPQFLAPVLIPNTEAPVIVFDAATGKEYGLVPHGHFTSYVHFVDDTTLATLSPTRDAIQLWDLPPRRALHPFIAWTCLGVALLLTGACWYAWRTAKMEQRPVPR